MRMFTRMFLVAAVLLLAIPIAACTPSLTDPDTASVVGGVIDATGTKAPAPLQASAIDEKGLIAAFSAFDVALTAVDGLVAARVIVPGSPRAIEVKGYLQRAQSALNAADAARKAGSATTYVAALKNAQAALVLATAALKKGSGA
jgi:hypothetical protein